MEGRRSASKHSQWSLGDSSLAYELEAWSYLRHKDYQLHLLQKEEAESKTRPIPTTERERLAYYWAYTTSAFKIQISYLQQIDYTGLPKWPLNALRKNYVAEAYGVTCYGVGLGYGFYRFFWLYVKNVLLKTLPTNYIHIFLAAYRPDEHLFGSKMIPLLHGINWQVILCGVLQLVASADILALYVQYVYKALNYSNPWSKCRKIWSKIDHEPNKPFQCFDINKFKDITSSLKYAGNDTDTSFGPKHNFYYIPKNGTLFTESCLRYFISKWVKVNILKYTSHGFGKEYDLVLNLSFVWIVAALFYNQLYRKYMWKALYQLQLVVNSFYVIIFLLIFAFGLEVEYKKHDSWLTTMDMKAIDLAKRWDFDFLAESISGPPVVHLLTSRSSDTVNPARDSALVTASNSFMYFFKGIVYYRLKLYVEDNIQAPLYVSSINPYPIFYLWAFFFDSIFFGPVIARVFYIIVFLIEMLVFILTYQLLIDVIVCEWKWAKRWVTTLLLSGIGVTLSFTLLYTTKMLLYVFTTAITSLTEVVVICWAYPVNRLTDDIHFHNGTPAAAWRRWSLRMLPLYFIYKTYIIFHTLMVVVHEKFADHQRDTVNADYSPSKWVWLVGVIPLPIGVLYAVFNCVKEKQSWRDLLYPRSDWGPKEYLARQLRKKFQSKQYVGSQASRYLSRHMMSRAQHTSYKLDLCYDGETRRSTDPGGYEGEWKNI